jgi:Protein of unknown function (DUF3606)
MPRIRPFNKRTWGYGIIRFLEGIVPEVNLKPIPQDEQRVNIFDEAEAKYWAKRFGCTRAQLEAAVMKVGVMTKSVEKQLKGE